MAKVKIVGRNGISNTTKLYIGDAPLPGVTSIFIDPIVPNTMITATIKLKVDELNLEVLNGLTKVALLNDAGADLGTPESLYTDGDENTVDELLRLFKETLKKAKEED